jgi:hypothetical protein
MLQGCEGNTPVPRVVDQNHAGDGNTAQDIKRYEAFLM